MNTHMLRAMLLVGCLGGLAWAQEPDCSVEVGDVHIAISDPTVGSGNANATCVVVANFPATITPTVETEAGFKNPANNHWIWSATIDGHASKNIAPNEESVAPITVAVSGVTLSDPAIPTATKVATVMVTITEDESKSLFRLPPVKWAGKTTTAKGVPKSLFRPTLVKQPGQVLASAVWRPMPIPGVRKP